MYYLCIQIIEFLDNEKILYFLGGSFVLCMQFAGTRRTTYGERYVRYGSRMCKSKQQKCCSGVP